MSDKSRENSLWKWLRDNTGHLHEHLHIQRIENIAGVGTPDVEGYLRDVGQFWIELKAVARPKRDGLIETGIDEDQVRWHRNRWRIGAQSWFLIQVGSGHSAKRYLIPGRLGLKLLGKVLESDLEELALVSPNISAPNLLKMLGK